VSFGDCVDLMYFCHTIQLFGCEWYIREEWESVKKEIKLNIAF